MYNIGLGNLEDLASMENITIIGLPKIPREYMDWILLAQIMPSDAVEFQIEEKKLTCLRLNSGSMRGRNICDSSISIKTDVLTSPFRRFTGTCITDTADISLALKL